jgi:hypothetical protein
MPDTGEDREIRGRVNAKEAEIALETRKLQQKSGPRAQKAQTRSIASKKNSTRSKGK